MHGINKVIFQSVTLPLFVLFKSKTSAWSFPHPCIDLANLDLANPQDLSLWPLASAVFQLSLAFIMAGLALRSPFEFSLLTLPGCLFAGDPIKTFWSMSCNFVQGNPDPNVLTDF